MNWEINSILRIINVVLAVLAILPSHQLLRHVWKEKKFIDANAKNTNYVLRVLFTFFIIVVFLNAGISILTLLEVNINIISLHSIANVRTLVVNSGILAISMALNAVSHKIFNGNTKRTKS